MNQAMLESVAAGDWENYSQVCSPEITCFEAESEGYLIEGHAFHRYYFDLANQNKSAPSPVNVTMARPHLRWLSDDTVVVSYTRLTQKSTTGNPSRPVVAKQGYGNETKGLGYKCTFTALEAWETKRRLLQRATLSSSEAFL